jgi:hypothetical protein
LYFQFSSLTGRDILTPKAISSSENQIKSVYPGTAKEVFLVEYQITIESSVELIIFDIYGNQMLKTEARDVVLGINQIPFSNLVLKSGMYQIALMVNGKLQDMEKLIIL